MGKFIKRTLFFGAIIFTLLFISETLVPNHWVTFRSWEAFKTNSSTFIGPFFPNQYTIRTEYGGSSHHTKYTIKKENIEWYTDELGFRNKEFIKNPDIVFIGASNINGTAATQDSILSSRVADLTGYTTYSIAPGHFSKFVQMVDAGIIEKPKILVYGCIERMLPKFKKPKKSLPPIYGNENSIEKIVRKNIPDAFKIAYLKIEKRNTKNFVKARIAGSKGLAIRSKIDERMTFVQGRKSNIKLDDKKLNRNANVIKAYDNYCKKNGIEFIFFPIPNKETVYYNLVPFQRQPKYLNQLTTKLREKNVTVINTLKLYNQAKNKGQLLYHYDDSHWNENGINIVAEEVARLAKSRMK